MIGEYVIIGCALLALVHARRNGRASLLIWLAALVAGTGNDLIFMALPLVDTFWQAQASIMLTPRLPLYIPCMYVVFMYWPTVGVRRLGLGRAAVAYLLMLTVNMTFFAPESHVSTGLHQLPGPCAVEESDILGSMRERYLCIDDYSEDFTFDCTTAPADGTQWFTVCGKEHSNYAAFAAVVGGLSLAGTAVLFSLFGARDRGVPSRDVPVRVGRHRRRSGAVRS